MNTNFLFKTETAKRLLAVVLICGLMMPAYAAWGRGGGGPVVPGGPRPLSQIPIPVPIDNTELTTLPEFTELAKYIKDVPSAIALGKALFWEMQAGSDGRTACATCHFHAGADNRLNNTIHPAGLSFTASGTGVVMGPNYTLNTNTYPSGDFPFVQVTPVDGPVGFSFPAIAPVGTIIRNIGNLVVGSQGVIKTNFGGIVAGTAVENGAPVLDTVFNLDFPNATDPARNLRQVTDRNGPSVINAVFNFSNFWDGRANNVFNGVNPFGPLDQNAQIWVNVPVTGLTPTTVAIPNAALASQAVGPALSPVEMSYAGRTFRNLGRKLLNNGLIPLGTQLVSLADSVLGNLSNGNNPGLKQSYTNMIQNAFNANLTTNTPVPDGSGFTQIEANFSLFWGLSIMFYESTLVSDRTPFDLFQLGNQNTLSLAAQKGFNTFVSKCATCHSGSEFTNAVVGSDILGCILPDCNPVSFTSNTINRLITDHQTNMELLLQVPDVISDSHFFNVGVRFTNDDLGRAGTTPATPPPGVINTLTSLPFPLSFSRLAKLQAQGLLPNQGALLSETPVLLPGTTSGTPDAVNGSFKVSGLRNIELTAPYFHNGSVFTLDQVLEFYTRGGNFPFDLHDGPTGTGPNIIGNQEQAINVQPLGKLRNNVIGRLEIVDFLKSLTDARVKLEQAPFDHPELRVPDGLTSEITLTATGGGPTPVPIITFTMNPVISPTLTSFQTISGAVVDGTPLNDSVTVAVTINSVQSAATVTLTTWTFDILSMPVGSNTISLIATSVTGATSSLLPTTIVLLPTALIFGAPFSVTNRTDASLTVGGIGVATYQYQVDNGPFSADTSTTAPITLSGLTEGFHAVAVLGKDATGQFQQPLTSPTTASWRVKSTPPVLNLDPVPSTVTGTLTIGGTTELGVIPQVSVNATANIGQVSAVPVNGLNTWSCTIGGFKNGPATITVISTDIAFNQTRKAVDINVILPDGAFKGTGVVDITDAVKALRFAVGLDAPTADELLRGDVAPLANGVPVPDGRIDVDDALLILKKAVNLITF